MGDFKNKVGILIQSRVEQGLQMRAALGTQGAEVAERLGGVGGLTDTQWAVWLEGLQLEQRKHDERLLRVEIELATERADDVVVRAERNQAHHALYDMVVETKEYLRDAATQQRLGLNGPTPRDPAVLASYVRAAIFSLRKHPGAIPGPLSLSLPSTDIADRLEGLLDELERSLQAIKNEARKADQWLSKRNQVLKDWQRVYIANGKMAEGAFRRAGLSELADRIRPTERRARGLDSPASSAASDALPTIDVALFETDVSHDEVIEVELGE